VNAMKKNVETKQTNERRMPPVRNGRKPTGGLKKHARPNGPVLREPEPSGPTDSN